MVTLSAYNGKSPVYLLGAEHPHRLMRKSKSSEREFNKRAGLSTDQCDVPEFMRYEPLPPHNTVFDISKTEMDRIWTVAPIPNQF